MWKHKIVYRTIILCYVLLIALPCSLMSNSVSQVNTFGYIVITQASYAVRIVRQGHFRVISLQKICLITKYCQ